MEAIKPIQNKPYRTYQGGQIMKKLIGIINELRFDYYIKTVSKVIDQIGFVNIVKIKCDTYLYSHTPCEESLLVKYFMPQIIVLIFLQNVNVKMVVKVAKKISTWMSSFNVRVKTFHVICRNIRDTHREVYGLRRLQSSSVYLISI